MNPTIKANPKGARASYNQSMLPTPTPQSIATPAQTSNAPISPTIEASRLSTSSVAVPAPVTSNAAQTKLNGTLGTIAQGLELSAKEQPTTPVEPPKPTLRDTITDRLSSILNLQGTQADRTAELQKEQGLFEKQQIVTDLENQYRAKERFYTKEEEKIRKNSEGKTATAIEQDVATLQRQRNSELADIAIQQQAASGNYRTAFDIVEAKIDAEFEPLKNEIETLKTMYSFYQNDLTESEKLQAQARIQEKESALAFERNKEMARYEQQLRQSDPLYQANLANVYSQINARNADITSGVLTDAEIKAIDTSPQGKKVTTLGDLKQKLAEYQELVRQYGTSSFGSQKARLDASFADLKIAYKTAAELGALQGPDIVLLEEALRPASFANPITQAFAKATGGGVGSINAALEQAQNVINQSAGNSVTQLLARNPAYRNSEYVNSLIDPLATAVVDENTYDTAPVGSILRDVDGSLLQKQKDGTFKAL
jgi:hypothetical protein